MMVKSRTRLKNSNNDNIGHKLAQCWIKIDTNITVLYTANNGGLNWSAMCRRIITDLANGLIIEDIDMNYNMDQQLQHHPLPRRINQTRRTRYYLANEV